MRPRTGCRDFITAAYVNENFLATFICCFYNKPAFQVMLWSVYNTPAAASTQTSEATDMIIWHTEESGK